MNASKPTNFDEYIASFPSDVQRILEKIKNIIKEAVPEAEEKISYGIPTFTLNNKYLVYFAAYKKHIGMYPAPVENEAFMEDFSKYLTGKGTLQFPLEKPIPYDVITKFINLKVKESMEKAAKLKAAKLKI